MSRWGGSAVTRVRAVLAATLPRPCWRCGVTIEPGEEFDVDHVTPRAEGGAVWDAGNWDVAHVSCNRSAGGQLGNERRSRAGRRLRSW